MEEQTLPAGNRLKFDTEELFHEVVLPVFATLTVAVKRQAEDAARTDGAGCYPFRPPLAARNFDPCDYGFPFHASSKFALRVG